MILLFAVKILQDLCGNCMYLHAQISQSILSQQQAFQPTQRIQQGGVALSQLLISEIRTLSQSHNSSQPLMSSSLLIISSQILPIANLDLGLGPYSRFRVDSCRRMYV